MRTRGFTLVETMVAIAILVVAVTAPLTLASQSLFTGIYAKDQTIAFYLAQEALEVVREKRDANFIKYIDGQATRWLDGIPKNAGLLVDAPNDLITGCSGGTFESCFTTPLLSDGAFYTYRSGTPTRFYRAVQVVEDTPDEAIVVSEVRWRTGMFRERSIRITQRLYNWASGPAF